MPTLHPSRARRRVARVVTAAVVSLALALGTVGLSAAPATAAATSVATNAEFKKIKNGQTLAQVRAIVDGRGTKLSDDLYRWKSTQGRYVFVFFDEGRVIIKQRLVVASDGEYRKIKKRDSYDRVKKIIGGPSLLSYQDNDVRYRVWPSPDLEAIVTVAFKRGKVIEKDRVADFFGDDIGFSR